MYKREPEVQRGAVGIRKVNWQTGTQQIWLEGQIAGRSLGAKPPAISASQLAQPDYVNLSLLVVVLS